MKTAIKTKGYLFLFLSFTGGISLTGCNGLLEGGDSGKSVTQLKREAHNLLEETNEILAEQHTCTETINAVGEVFSVVEAATTRDQAKEAKRQAKAVKEKAENCTKHNKGINEVKKAVTTIADRAIKLAEAELKKSQESTRSNSQKTIDEVVFNGAKTDAIAAKAAAEIAVTTDQAKEAKNLAENALSRIRNHANKRAK